MIPENATWQWREVVTAELMNRRTRDVHKWLYAKPAVRLTARQVYSDPTKPTPAGTVGQGWAGTNQWIPFRYYRPGEGPLPAHDYDTTGGQMLLVVDNTVARIVAPEDGLYRVSVGGVIDTQTGPVDAQLRVGAVPMNGSFETGNVYTATNPGRSNNTRRIGSMTADIPLRKGAHVGVAGLAKAPCFVGTASMVGTSYTSVEWIGRHP
jgi:hypothetical protein